MQTRAENEAVRNVRHLAGQLQYPPDPVFTDDDESRDHGHGCGDVVLGAV